MKNIKDFIYENENVNEGVWTIAGGVINGLIGLKLVRGLLTGLISAGLKGAEIAKWNKQIKQLEFGVQELESLLSKYPKTKRWIYDNSENLEEESVKELLDHAGPFSELAFQSAIVKNLDKIEDWAKEDLDRFTKLWYDCKSTVQAIKDKEAEKLKELLKKS